jgi:hypothetical protein
VIIYGFAVETFTPLISQYLNAKQELAVANIDMISLLSRRVVPLGLVDPPLVELIVRVYLASGMTSKFAVRVESLAMRRVCVSLLEITALLLFVQLTK